MEGFAEKSLASLGFNLNFETKNRKMENQHQTNSGRILLGLILILVGILYAFDVWRYLPNMGDWIFSWGSLFLVIGLVNISSKRNPFLGIVFILGSAYFYIQEFFFHDHIGWNDVWPVGLVVLGLGMIIRGAGRRGIGRFGAGSNPDGGPQQTSTSSFDDMAVFGGGEKIITTDNFTGGKITALFGGSDIDLTQSKIKNGPAVLDLFVMFGGTTIYAPKDWNVNIQLTPIFGGFSDKRFNISPITNDANNELIVKGLVLFGGGEIKGR